MHTAFLLGVLAGTLRFLQQLAAQLLGQPAMEALGRTQLCRVWPQQQPPGSGATYTWASHGSHGVNTRWRPAAYCRLQCLEQE